MNHDIVCFQLYLFQNKNAFIRFQKIVFFSKFDLKMISIFKNLSFDGIAFSYRSYVEKHHSFAKL